MDVQVQVVNAFSLNGTGGNPAGVVFDADQCSNEEKQKIAAAAGFPETAFVSSSKLADFKLEFFTPIKQIPHCGHATIATFSYLKQTGKISKDQSSKETIDGCRSILFKNELAFMEQRSPIYMVPEESMDEILESLHINKADLLPGELPTVVNTGNSFLIVPVKNEETLAAIEFDRDGVNNVSAQFDLIGYYLYTNSTSGNHDVTARMFAPYYGIDEEAATGMAAGPLAAYLYDIVGNKNAQFLIEQGRFMKVPSRSLITLDLEIKEEKIVRLFAGGSAYLSGSNTVSM
jgi:PhzF family phenazine biosynthesis protein